jgi:hypothetical protein
MLVVLCASVLWLEVGGGVWRLTVGGIIARGVEYHEMRICHVIGELGETLGVIYTLNVG